MQSKYTTGQAILIPAKIRAVEERDGAIFYKVDTDIWEGIPEEQIVVDDKVSARVAFNKAMTQLSREIW